jgi:hypothetical protein
VQYRNWLDWRDGRQMMRRIEVTSEANNQSWKPGSYQPPRKNRDREILKSSNPAL